MEARSMILLLALSIGILSMSQNVIITIILSLTALIVTAVSAFFIRRKAVFAIVTAFFFAAGGCLFAYHNYVSNEYANEYVTLTGRICELPYTYDGKTYYYIIQPRGLTFMDRTVKFKSRVRLSSEEHYSFGDCIYASGFLTEFNEKLNDTGFDARLYSKSRSLSFKMQCIKSGFIDKYYTVSARDIFLFFQSKCAAYIDANYSGTANAYLKAFIIGETRGFDDKTKDNLIYSGARRFLYAPFIHISIIVSILGIIFCIFKTERYKRDTASAIIFLIYCSFVSAKPIFIKALISSSFILLYRKRFGYVNRADALCTAGIFTLFINPFFLFDYGFVISMVYSISYIMFSNALTEALSFAGRFKYRISTGFISIFGLIPVYAAFFHGTSLSELIITAAAVPLTTAIILSFWSSMIIHTAAGITLPADTVLSAFLYGFNYLVQSAAHLPFSYIFIPSPNPYQTALYYSVLLYIYSCLKQRRAVYAKTFFLTVAVCTAIIVTFSYIYNIGKIKLMFVNVGQGDGAVISVCYRDNLLIDGGGSAVYSTFNEGRYVYVPFLRSRGISRASAIVTHYHKDHCQGIIEAVRSLKISTVYAPDCTPDNEMRQELVRAAAENGTRIEFVRAGDKITYKSGMTVEFISPDAEDLKSENPNETSLVAYITYGSFSALFTGDTTKAQETKMLSGELVKGTYILKAAHHGSDTSSSAEFIDAVSPYAAVISVGEENTYDLPDEEVLERLSPYKIFRTDLNGNITVTADKHGICRVEAYKK